MSEKLKWVTLLSKEQHRKWQINVTFVFKYIRHFLPYWYYIMLDRIGNRISLGFRGIIFQGYQLDWFCSYQMKQLEQSWQYCHSCIAVSI